MKKISVATLQQLAAVLCASALFFAADTAQAEQRPTMTSHVPAAVSSGVAPLAGHLPSAQRLSLAISLPLRNPAELDDLLQQIYDPQNPNFHNYLSVPEFTARFGPAEADYEAVLHFAQSYGLVVIDMSDNRMVLDVEGPVANIESAFHVTLGIYQHPTESRTFYAPDREPSVDLDVPLLHISGLDNFSLPHAKNIRSSQPVSGDGKTTGSGPGGDFIGSDMRAAYYGSGKLTGKGQSVGLFELAGYQLSDVINFFKQVNEPLKVPVKGVSVNGAMLNCPPKTCDDSEQALDIEMAISMAPGLKEVLVYVGNSDAAIFNQMAVDNTAKQLSCSWGWSDNESVLDPIFKEFAAQGQSLFVATGDSGSGTPGDVVWPADDPYVTAVGGTDFDQVDRWTQYWSANNASMTEASALSYIPEIPWNDTCGQLGITGCVAPAPPQNVLNIIAGSGGASTLYGKPSWQSGSGVPMDGHRDLPDVSLFASNGYNSSFYIMCQADASLLCMLE